LHGSGAIDGAGAAELSDGPEVDIAGGPRALPKVAGRERGERRPRAATLEHAVAGAQRVFSDGGVEDAADRSSAAAGGVLAAAAGIADVDGTVEAAEIDGVAVEHVDARPDDVRRRLQVPRGAAVGGEVDGGAGDEIDVRGIERAQAGDGGGLRPGGVDD